MAFDGVAVSVKDNDISEPHSDIRYHLGVRHFKDGNEYVYVYNGQSAIGTGKYCVLEGIGSSITSGYTVTVTNASLTNRLAGVAQTTIAASYYGFVMVKGTGLVATDSAAYSCNVGVGLCLGTDGGFRPPVDSLAVGDVFAFTMNSFVTTVGTAKARIFGSVL